MSNQTTDYTYDGDGNVLSMTAVMPTGENSQTTDYVYGVGTTIGTDLFSNDLIATVEYPDPTTGDASASAANDVSYTYDNLGETLTKTDQNGTTHTYSYDVLGRETLDAVTTLGSGVDGSVMSLGYSYNALGMPYQQTSYNSATSFESGNIVNQDQDTYNGLGQLTEQYQSHSGAVDTSTTPATGYVYGDISTGSLLTEMVYPNGRILDYGYDGNALDDAIGRVDNLADGGGSADGTPLVSYSYLGAGTIIGQSFGNGVTETTTLDAFNRIAEMNYTNTGTSTVTDDFQYGYDADGNVVSKVNGVNANFSELYTYDSLNRLTSFARGTLNDDNTAVTTANTLPGSSQSWDLDSIGNQQSVTTDGTTADNTQNSQNELTNFNGFTLSYDNAGNMTMDQNGNVMSYDAWNRLVSDGSLTTSLATVYTYDADGNRITEQQTAIADQGPILVVNNGTAQRSMIDSLTLVFDHPVTVSSGAVTLSGVTNGDITISVTNPSGDGKTYLITFSGDEIASGSLPDDVYTLSVSASGVHDVSTGDATLASDATYVFARLFGDINGDGTVNGTDYFQFKQADSAYTGGDAVYNPAFDFNADGTVNGTDYTAFEANYLTSAPSYTPGTGAILIGVPTGTTAASDISSWVAGPVTDVYFDSLGQAIEERQGSIVTAQYVWNIDYQNDLLLRDDNSTSGSLGKSGSGLGQRLYSQHDANFDITAFTNASGEILQRFIYSPYGVQTALNPNWTLSYAPNSIYGFQGGRYDAATGLLHFGERDYDPATATWIERDPAGYVNGPDRYEFVESNSIAFTDPSGEGRTYQTGPNSGPSDEYWDRQDNRELPPPKTPSGKRYNMKDGDALDRAKNILTEKANRQGKTGAGPIDRPNKSVQRGMNDVQNIGKEHCRIGQPLGEQPVPEPVPVEPVITPGPAGSVFLPGPTQVPVMAPEDLVVGGAGGKYAHHEKE